MKTLILNTLLVKQSKQVKFKENILSFEYFPSVSSEVQDRLETMRVYLNNKFIVCHVYLQHNCISHSCAAYNLNELEFTDAEKKIVNKVLSAFHLSKHKFSI